MIPKNILEKLYLKKKLSVAEIAGELEVSFPKAVYWVRKHKIPIRSQSERTYIKHNRNGDPFHPKGSLTKKEQQLLMWGLALYWAEGSRKSKHTVQLANLDHRMLQLFVKFLRKIVCVDESRIRLDVRVYQRFDRQAAKRHWVQLLSISPKQVFVYPHTDQRSRVNKQWSTNGIATISVANTKLKAWLDQRLEENIDQMLIRWSVAETRVHRKTNIVLKRQLTTKSYV